jgi:hypothetical protein
MFEDFGCNFVRKHALQPLPKGVWLESWSALVGAQELVGVLLVVEVIVGVQSRVYNEKYILYFRLGLFAPTMNSCRAMSRDSKRHRLEVILSLLRDTARRHFVIIEYKTFRFRRLFNLEPILRLLNLQLHTTPAMLKTRYANSFAVNFYNAGIVTHSRRIGSCLHRNRFTCSVTTPLPYDKIGTVRIFTKWLNCLLAQLFVSTTVCWTTQTSFIMWRLQSSINFVF